MNVNAMLMVASWKMNYMRMRTVVLPLRTRTSCRRHFFKPVHCTPLHYQQQQKQEVKVESEEIMCEPCNGTGWLICDFCNGQKTNVKANNRRIYRRCPACRAVGLVLCSKCKVFKCVTFPNYSDGEDLTSDPPYYELG